MKFRTFTLFLIFSNCFFGIAQNVSNILISPNETHMVFLENKNTLKIKEFSVNDSPQIIATGLASTNENKGLADERFLLWNKKGNKFIYEKNHQIYIYDIEKEKSNSFQLPKGLNLFKFYRINQLDSFDDILYFSAGYSLDSSSFELFEFDLNSGKLKEISKIKEHISNVTVSENGKYIAYSYYQSSGDEMYSGIHILNRTTENIIFKHKFKDKAFMSNLAFIGNNKLTTRNVYGENYVIDFLSFNKIKSFIRGDFGYFINGGVGNDQLLQLNFENDKRLYNILNIKTGTNKLLLKKKNLRYVYVSKKDKNYTIWYLKENGKTPKQLYKRVVFDNDNSKDFLQFDFNANNPLKKLDYKVMDYQNSFNKKNNAFLYFPKNTLNSSKKLPLILIPYGRYSDTYPDMGYFMNDIFFQFINKGFALAFVNTSGVASQRLSDEYGKRQLMDTHLFLKKLCKEYSVDQNRIYVAGHSHGATMVYYYLTHSKLFNAGIAINGAADWIEQAKLKTMTGLPWEMGGEPKDLLEKYKEYSPIENLSKLSAPLLIVSGGKDTQIPAKINAFKFFEKSKSFNLDVQHLHLKNEGHLIESKTNREKLKKYIEKIIKD